MHAHEKKFRWPPRLKQAIETSKSLVQPVIGNHRNCQNLTDKT